MEDFNNIQTDPIPEGLEFNESYMQSAFELYDAEKQKRKRRLLIWWITSALGFSCVLLIGTYFFIRRDASDTSVKKADLNEQVVAQESKTETGNNSQGKDQPDKIKTTHSGSFQSANQEMPPGKTFKIESGSEEQLKTSKIKTRENSNTHKKHQRKQPGKTLHNNPVNNVSGVIHEHTDTVGTTNETVHPAPSNKIAEIDSGIVANNDLPLRSALLAFKEDSASQLPETCQKTTLRAEDTVLHKHQVFMNLGVNTLFGMQELKNRVTFRESVGISYSYQFNPKIAIGAGLEYHSISRISYKRMIGDTTNSDNTTTILNKTTLNYISFLPQVSYRLGTKHKVTAGFGIGYLLVNPSERYEIENYTQESSKRTNSKLYYSTFNKFNFSASLGYSYQFSTFMSAQVSYHFGFTDITINNSFNTTLDRNSRLQLGLKIKLY